jgi:hypothetical protein
VSGEIKFRGASPGQTNYFRILGSGNSVWSASGAGGFGVYNATEWTDYAISATEQGSTNIYIGDVPLAVPGGSYDIDARRQLAASPAVTDPSIAQGMVEWNGSMQIPLFNLATSGQVGQLFPIRLARGVMIQNFPIYFKSSADHVTPFTSGVVSGQIWRDGATSPSPLQSGAFTEVGNGFYNLQALTSGDLLATTVKLLFSAQGISGGQADVLPMSVVLQRSSGQ